MPELMQRYTSFADVINRELEVHHTFGLDVSPRHSGNGIGPTADLT